MRTERRMTERSAAIFSVTAYLLLSNTAGFAETRGIPFTREQLYKQSTLVFKGTVSDIETVEGFAVSFPAKASSITMLKGRGRLKEITFQHKHPGFHVIFEQEFSKPELGQWGTFYVQNNKDTRLLIGYISDTKAPQPPAEIGNGFSREEVLAVLGKPDKVHDFILPGQPFYGPQESLANILPPGAVTEEWVYESKEEVLFVWFARKSVARREDWKVVATGSYPRGVVY